MNGTLRLLPACAAICAGLANPALLRAEEPNYYRPPNLLASLTAPGAYAKLSLGVLYDHATVGVPEWGSDRAGLGKRVEFRFLGLGSRMGIDYAATRLRGTSTAYVRCACKGFPKRSWHVLVMEATERRPDGTAALPVSRLAGLAGSAFATSLDLPKRYGAAEAASRAGMMVTTDIGFNMLTEFWPEIKRTLLFRKK